MRSPDRSLPKCFRRRWIRPARRFALNPSDLAKDVLAYFDIDLNAENVKLADLDSLLEPYIPSTVYAEQVACQRHPLSRGC